MNSARVLTLLALLALAALAATLGAQVARQAAVGGIDAAGLRLAGLAPGFLLARLAAVAAVVGGWPFWIAQIARRRGWPPARAAALAGLRWRVLLWFAVFELAVVQGGRIARWIGG